MSKKGENNNKKKLTALDVLRYVLLGLCLFPEGVSLIAFSSYTMYLVDKTHGDFSSDYKMAIAGIVISALFIISTIAGLVLTRLRKSGVILNTIFTKMGLFCIFMAVPLSDDSSISASVAFAVLGAIIVSMALFFYFLMAKKDSEKKKMEKVSSAKHPYFTGFDIDQLRKRAVEEYLYLNNKKPEDITEEENIYIYDCAANEMTYFLTWLIRKGYVSKKFIKKHGDNIKEAFLSESIDPNLFMRNEMDYEFDRSDISNTIHFFVDGYLTLPNERNHLYKHTDYAIYLFDYYRVVVSKNDQGIPIKYCHDFSWDKYRKLEQVIDERFKNICDVVSEGRSNPSFDKGMIHSSVYNVDISVGAKREVEEEYIGRCLAVFDDWSFRLKEELVKEVYKQIRNRVPDINYIRNNLKPNMIDIHKPKVNEEAFIVYGEIMGIYNEQVNPPAKYEPRIMLYWIVRNGILVGVYPLIGGHLPWDLDEDIQYKKKVGRLKIQSFSANKYKGEASISDEQLEQLCRDGVIKKDQLILQGFNDLSVKDVYLPEEIAEIKDYYVSMAEALVAAGLADYYKCTPKYSVNLVTPTTIKVEARKNDAYDRLVFMERIVY